MNTNTSPVRIMADGSVEREFDGVTEHKHTGYDYWHPVSRVHKEAVTQTMMETERT